jgi:hypothetical protein
MTINWLAAQAVATIALVLTSGGAIAYAALQLRHEREYRSVNNLERQLSFFLSDSFVAARRRLAQARVSENGLLPWSVDEPPVVAFDVLDFYEHLGLLVKKGHLDVYDVWHTFYEWAQPVYADLRPLTENPKSPYAVQYSDLRKLMRAMDQIQIHRMHAKRASLSTLLTPERILDYYRYELETSTGRVQPMSRRAQRKAEAAAAAKERNLA